MRRWSPRPPSTKFVNGNVDYYNVFAREALILEYGPVAAEAAQEQIHKGKCQLL